MYNHINQEQAEGIAEYFANEYQKGNKQFDIDSIQQLLFDKYNILLINDGEIYLKKYDVKNIEEGEKLYYYNLFISQFIGTSILLGLGVAYCFLKNK